MNRTSQRGIALVITLIMLAVVTVMAVVFLSISRRERTAVSVTADLTDAKLMADAAVARAQAEIIARIAAHTNLFAYDLLVSTNFIQRTGFRSGGSSFTNVSYVDQNLLPLANDNDIWQNLTNLFYDPRPPVYVVTNSATGQSEFRFYLDLNRNGRFDDTDYEPWKSPFGTNSVGDPQWIGVLEHPDMPHSPSNRFIGRYAFIVLPAGKMLDLNYCFNSVKSRGTVPTINGYGRNEGFGSWELNLAAFLTDLNTNMWRPALYAYDPVLGTASGIAFQNALSILNYRYQTNLPKSLLSANALFGATRAAAFTKDQIDDYGDGPLMTNVWPPLEVAGNSDNPDLPWPGSDNTNGYVNIQEVFDPVKSSPAFVNNLRFVIADRLRPYNYNTFSRLLSQLGTDSLPANRDKLNLNYDNVDAYGTIFPQFAAGFTNWTPIRFFTNAGNLLLQRQFGSDVSIQRIPIWPTNYYGASAHRMLQVAANIYDAMTNGVVLRAGTTNLYAPSVFRPLFGHESTNIFITGYAEVTNNVDQVWNFPWIDLSDANRRQLIYNGQTNVNVIGVNWVIGAKKGFPNFNEYYLQTSVQVSRRLQVQKANRAAEPIFRPGYEIGVSNFFGLEAWNSYLQAFPREVQMRITNQSDYVLRNGTNLQTAPLKPVNQPFTRLLSGLNSNITAGSWTSERYLVPLNTQITIVTNSQFFFKPSPYLGRPADTNFAWETVPGFPVPDLKLYVTNRIQYVLIDQESRRVLDFVSLDSLQGSIDITRHLIGRTNLFQDATNREGSFWLTNRAGGDPRAMTIGVSNQIFASMMNWLSEAEWRSLSLNPVTGQQKEKAIDGFRQFLGLQPIFSATNPAVRGQFAMAPFTPSRKLDLRMSWQANDPLVHYHIEDLYDPQHADLDRVQPLPPGMPAEPSNLGLRNIRYRPWGGRPGSSVLAINPAMQDPLIRRSDDWDFPTNKFPTIGGLGRVHRGSPWQTIYLKSGVADVTQWFKERGRRDTHPTNDWWILDVFTTAVNDNAARGLLSVNQTNVAAWSAVLSGVSVFTNGFLANPGGGLPVYPNLFIQPASPQLLTIVSNINLTRLQQPNQTFRRLGHVLASPALTVASPFLNTDPAQVQFGISDAAYERIPQQILSLLKEDEAYVAIYAFGQSLKPSDRSIVTAPGVYQNLCTNYQITGEVATKTVVRFFEPQPQSRTNRVYKAVVESYNVLSQD